MARLHDIDAFPYDRHYFGYSAALRLQEPPTPAKIPNLALWTGDAETDQAVQFVAADLSWLEVTDASLTPGAADFAISFWVKVTSVAALYHLFQRGAASAAHDGFRCYVNNGVCTWSIADGVTRLDGASAGLNLGTVTTGWHHVVANVSRTNNAWQVFIDGVSAGTADISAVTGAITNLRDLSIGRFSSTSPYFDGKLDSFGIWIGRTLTAVEIAALYNSGAGRTSADLTGDLLTDLVSWWDFQEISGIRHDSVGSNHLTQQFDASSTATKIRGTAGITAGKAVARAPGSGDAVSIIRNRAMSGSDLEQPTATQRPEYVRVDGVEWLAFDGVDDMLARAALTGLAEYVYAFVLRTGPDVTANQVVFQNTVSGTDLQAARIISSVFAVGHYNGTAYEAVKSGPVAVNTAYIAIYRRVGATGTLRLNGVNATGTTGPTASGSGFSLGARAIGDLPFGGRIAAALAYDNALADDQIGRIEKWANHKFKLGLSL